MTRIGFCRHAVCWGGVLGLALFGCQPASNSPVPDAVRKKLDERASAPRPVPSDDPSEPLSRTLQVTSGGPTQVRRFAVRPFEEWTMREVAAAALGRIGRPAVPKLVEALASENPSLRQKAADTLARIGPAAADAVPALIKALRDADPLVRKSAARALGQIGPDAEDAVPALIELLSDAESNSPPP